MKNKKKL